MKFYNTPFAEIVELKVADVITLSAEDDLAQYDDCVQAPSGWFNN